MPIAEFAERVRDESGAAETLAHRASPLYCGHLTYPSHS